MAQKKKKQSDDDEFYLYADETIELLDAKAVKRFNQAKKDCRLLDMDELTIIQTCKKLYSDLDSDVRKAFLDMAVLVYRRAWLDFQKQKLKKSGKRKKEPTEKWLTALLQEYDPVTKYVYEHEVSRKEEYTEESIIASSTPDDEFSRGLRYWSRMVAHYADAVSDRTFLKACDDAGAEEVKWISMRDARVCEKCIRLDGKVFPIDKVPDKPHWGCRCTLRAV